MATLEPYLFFPGNAEEALDYYKSVFGGEYTVAMRYRDMPGHEHPPEWDGKIMHATFIADGVKLMASDSIRHQPGSETERVAMSIGTADTVEGQRIFDALALGGNVEMPYSKQFWGASFGMLTDRFGVDWMINAGG